MQSCSLKSSVLFIYWLYLFLLPQSHWNPKSWLLTLFCDPYVALSKHVSPMHVKIPLTFHLLLFAVSFCCPYERFGRECVFNKWYESRYGYFLKLSWSPLKYIDIWTISTLHLPVVHELICYLCNHQLHFAKYRRYYVIRWRRLSSKFSNFGHFTFVWLPLQSKNVSTAILRVRSVSPHLFAEMRWSSKIE